MKSRSPACAGQSRALIRHNFRESSTSPWNRSRSVALRGTRQRSNLNHGREGERKTGGNCWPARHGHLRTSCWLLAHSCSGCLDLRFYRIQIETRALLHRRELDGRHGELRDLLLDKHEAPELVLEPVEVLKRPFFRQILRPARALERIESEVRQKRYVGLGLVAEPATGLFDESILVVVDANSAEFTFAEVEDFVTIRWSLAVIRSIWL